jgi:signal transduction histidine kinase
MKRVRRSLRLVRPTGLRSRLLLTTTAGALVVVAALVLAFNLILDSRLRGDLDSLLRSSAAAQLQTVSIAHAHVLVAETADQAAPDTLAWVYGGGQALESPGVPAPVQRSVRALVASGRSWVTIDAFDTRLHAVAITEGGERLGTVVVAASLSPYERSARTALIASLILGALTVLGVAVMSGWVIGRALQPVAQLTAAAAGWGERDLLSRRFFTGEPHDEVTELASTFDQLLGRLASSLQREQRLTAEISHELRTPLAKIVTEAELCARRERTPERYRKALASIRASAQELERALDALLAAARSPHGGSRRSADARVAVDRAAAHVLPGHPRPDVSVEVHGRHGLRVAAEPELAERALVPIIANAMRFAHHRVDIDVTEDTHQITFEVRDDGPGVAEHLRERIFEPGVAAGNRSPGASGAGLGLALARRLAHAARGEVRCLPSPSGGRFQLCLPKD